MFQLRLRLWPRLRRRQSNHPPMVVAILLYLFAKLLFVLSDRSVRKLQATLSHRTLPLLAQGLQPLD
jgi:hypothetical protein